MRVFTNTNRKQYLSFAALCGCIAVFINPDSANAQESAEAIARITEKWECKWCPQDDVGSEGKVLTLSPMWNILTRVRDASTWTWKPLISVWIHDRSK